MHITVSKKILYQTVLPSKMEEKDYWNQPKFVEEFSSAIKQWEKTVKCRNLCWTTPTFAVWFVGGSHLTAN